MKKTVLFPFFLFAFCTVTLAQNQTNKLVLINTAKTLEQESRASYAAALILAKEKGWPLFYTSKNNSIASLIGVDAFGQPRYKVGLADPLQATTVNTNKVWPGGIAGLSLNGSSDSLTNKLGIWDEGKPRLTHRELAARVTVKDNANNTVEHSTHALGIMMNTGVNPLAKGMAYGLKGAYSYDWYNDASEMAVAASNGLLISNHSYGIISGWDYNADSSRWEYNGRWNEKEDLNFGLYDLDAQRFDSIAYNAPNYLIVKSAGNSRTTNGPPVGQDYWRRDQNGKWYDAGARPDSLSSNNGYGIIPTDVNAKNLLTIGAVYGIAAGYSKKEEVVMTSFSSWGPTDDGRIKPDLVGDGYQVFSSLSANDSSYGYLSGTSMASPEVAGSLLLLQELSQQFSPKKFIRSATVKALAIHTANEAGLYPGPDFKFGWGLLNLSEAAIALSNALKSNNNTSSADLVYEKTLQNKQSDTFTIVASGIKPVKATLVWTDVKGTVQTTLNDTTPKLVNDLDLKISSANSNFLPWTLSAAKPDSPAIKGNNRLDNVEKVELDTSFIGKTYTITVNHKGNLERGKQDYSLIISGAGGNVYCNSSASSTAGTRIDSTSINNIQFANTTNNKYIDNSKYNVLGEANGNLSLSLKLGSSDTSNATRFVKVFIDYNNNGNFEDSETVATSIALKNGLYSTNITLPVNLKVGTFTKLRIVAMETSSSSNVKACGTYATGETQDYTLKIANPSTDLAISELINPTGSICKKAMQYITVKIINNGSTAQSNLPLSLLVKDGTNTILAVSETFKGRLIGYESMNYTFQKPISVEANKTYSITATVNINNDQLKSNNSLTASFVSGAIPTTPLGTANNCSGQLKLAVTNPIASTSYLWYDSSNLLNPIAAGTNAVLTATKNSVYLTQGFQGTAGPVSNNSLAATGGYNNFSGNYIKINATRPITIETTKLYTGYPGKISFTLGSLVSDNGSSYTYYALQTVNLNVEASSPSPTFPVYDSVNKVNIPTPYVSADSGKIYALNFNIQTPGDYIILVACDSATLFRNDALTTTTYPNGPAKIFSFTGNSVSSSPSTTFQKYWYFFYNTQVSTSECLSAAASIPVQTTANPTITRVSDSLTSSAANVYQWYLNDNPIQGAISKSYRATINGLYKISTVNGDCQTTSPNLLVLVRDPNGNIITDVQESNPKDINLKISSDDNIENLIKGNSFYIQFSKIQTEGIALEIVNATGNKVFQIQNLINQQAPQRITTSNLSTGIYFIKIYANKKIYVQRVFITNN